MMFSRFFSLACIIKSKSNDALVKCVFNQAKQRKGQKRVTPQGQLLARCSYSHFEILTFKALQSE